MGISPARLGGESKKVKRLRNQVMELREQLAEARAAQRILELKRQLSQEEQQRITRQILPHGVAVIGFCDLEGFTTYVEERGDEEAYELLQEHNESVRSCLKRHGGMEIKQLGDGFMISFTSAKQALLCAAEIGDRIEEIGKDRGLELKVRVGVHAGEIVQGERDVIGRTVNLAERIMSEARGGQILLSKIVKDLAGSLPGFQYVELGERRLKGFEEPQHIYELQPVPSSVGAREARSKGS